MSTKSPGNQPTFPFAWPRPQPFAFTCERRVSAEDFIVRARAESEAHQCARRRRGPPNRALCKDGKLYKHAHPAITAL